MTAINSMYLRHIDLNLLVALRALIQERHVTRAAERLGITQPAMSATLARLRSLFGDQLLVRGPRGMTLTPRAEMLAQELDGALSAIERMIALPSAFTPGESRRTFNLIGTDFIELILLPRIGRELLDEAPGIQFVFWPSNPKNLEALMGSGEIDLAIGYLPEAAGDLVKSTLFVDRFACIARRDHPRIVGELSLDQFTRLSHVQVLPRDAAMYAAPIDQALAQLSLVRRVAVWEPSFLPVPHVVAATDLVSTLPRRFAEFMAGMLPLAVYEPPVALPEIDFAMYWHPRSHNEAGHKWLRDRIAAILRD